MYRGKKIDRFILKMGKIFHYTQYSLSFSDKTESVSWCVLT